MKELGLSLEQIARLVDQATSTKEIRGMLALCKAQLEQSVQEEMERLRVVEARLHQIDAHGQIEEPDVVLKSVPAQEFLALREVLPDMDAVRSLVERINAVVPGVVGPNNLGYIAVVIHTPIYDPQAFDLEIGYVFTEKSPASLRLSEKRVLTRRELPAVATMATLVHVGRVNDRHQGYSVLGSWVEQNKWQINGLGREILMQLPLKGKENEAVIELQLPISRLNPSELGQILNKV